MKKHILFLLCLIAVSSTRAQVFADHFADKTLRVDYIFNGNASGQAICLDGLSALPTWAGRKHHLAELPLQGNGQIIMRNAASGKTIYTTSFSSLFQEWLETDEAQNVTKGFENTFLLPYPLQPVEIEITLLDPRRNVRASMKHIVHPNDVLIVQKGNSHITPHKYLLHNDSPEKCINVAILAEGYTLQEMQTFYEDADIACKSIFDHEPFKSMKKRFNVVAVASPSTDSGVSVPRLNEWKHTAFGSHFSTFYSDRYLTTSRVKAIHDALAGIPYEHIIILANTEEYGGGGIYNSYTLTTAHHPMFRPVVLGLFYFGGDAQGDAVLMSVDSEMWQPAQTDALLFLMYGLFGIAVVATVAAFLFQFGTALKDNPGNALKSLIGVIVLVAVVVIAWAMGSDEPLNIPGYDGTDNVPFWLKITDMFLYSIYILFGATVLAIIFSSIKKKLS